MWCTPFGELSKYDAEIAGGKGASLGEMTGAGIPVPPGFVVIAGAFNHFLEETDLNVEIDAVLSTVDTKAIHTVDEASEKIQALILNAKMPRDIAEEIKKSFKELGAEFVAVRSSATSEDSADAAWAGQLDSFLNTTEETLLTNVQRCWASLFTPRAIFYRFEKELHGKEISVAVVVQKMVESDVSGVAFSVHPVTEDPDQLIIEAAYGLGEAIVSGQVTPDSYVVSKSDLELLDVNVAEQERGIYRNGDSGNEWKEIPTDKGSLQKLTDEQIINLSKLIIEIEKHYSFPCDIEWALEGGTFFITQSRPITTLQGSPHHKQDEEAGVRLAEAYDWEVMEEMPKIKLWYCWAPFVSYKDRLEEKYGLGFFRSFYVFQRKTLAMYYGEGEMKRAGEAMLAQDKKDGLFISSVLDDIQKPAQQFLEDARSLGEHYASISKEVLSGRFHEMYPVLEDIWVAGQAINCLEHGHSVIGDTLKDLLQQAGVPREKLGEIFTKLTTPEQFSNLQKEERDLSAIAERKDLAALQGHAKRYSWLGYDWTGPGYGLDYFKDRYNALIGSGTMVHILDEEAYRKKVTEEREAIMTEYPLNDTVRHYAQIASRIIFLKALRVDASWAFYEVMDAIFARFAKELDVKEELLAFLTPDEIERFLRDGNIDIETVQKRLELVVIECSDGEAAFHYDTEAESVCKILRAKTEVASQNIDTIAGVTGCPGRAKGRVKIIMTVEDISKMDEGDILVSNTTNPTLVPAMKKAAAIIADVGGLTSHAAIVSRELKKPCIIGTKIATKVLKDGDMVEVNADEGIVKKI